MIKRGNAKGLSTIVATLLIILLTLVAVGIIWVVVRNVIQSGAEQVSLGKFTLNLEIKNVIINPATPSNIDVRIKRNVGEGEIYGLKFIIDDGDTTEVVELNNFSLKELEERIVNLSLTSIPNASNIQKVSVAPIFKLESGKEVTGDVKDEYELPKSFGTVVSTGCLSSLECNDGNACTTNTCSGGVCSYPVITSCINNDGCCPPGCTSVNDNNCVQCANASQCNDSNSCTTDTCLAGVCSYPIITSCINNDGCCPSGCTSVNDNNCLASCGNNIKEGTEQCDGSDLGGATCAIIMGTGYTGTLSCSSCTFVTSLCVPPALSMYWTGELVTNGGFEWNNLTGWTTYGIWYTGADIAGNTTPANGSYFVYNTYANSSTYIYQDINLSTWASQIDAGTVRVNASMWAESGELPPQDWVRVQVMYLSASKTILETAVNSGDVGVYPWKRYGIFNDVPPIGARYVRMWGNTYESCCDSGCLDSYSVRVGYLI